MRRIFFDDVLDKLISDQGYLVIKGFAPVSVCGQLESYYCETDLADERPFSITNWNKDNEYRRRAHYQIVSQLSNYAAAYLMDYKPVMGVFTSKRPGENSEMLMHQDWSLVDENKFRSVSVWLALDDMDYFNGNLQVARFSHLYSGFPRGMNVPVPFEEIRNYLQKDILINLPLYKGDAVIFDHRLIHASPINNSAKVRVAAVLALIPEEADLVHYYLDPQNENELEILKLDDKNFFLLDFFDMPNKPKHLSSIAKVPFSFRQLSIADLNDIA